MTSPMTAEVSIQPWSEEALIAKAQLYIEQMEFYGPDDWQYGLWSALALELVARAALAHRSPVLLADTNRWRNINFALGFQVTAKKFSPTSISSSEVISRLEELENTVTPEIAGFIKLHIQRRNVELHTGELVFSELGTSRWLPLFYLSLQKLLNLMKRDLKDYVADNKSAVAMVEALHDEAAKSVAQDISAHKQVWLNKAAEEKEVSTAQATAWATRHEGHRVRCPSCESVAILHGSLSGPVSTKVDEIEGEVVQRQAMLPTSFECIACGLRILGLSRLAACGLGDAFSSKSTYTAADFFELYTADDLEQARSEGQPEYEEDFNEY